MNKLLKFFIFFVLLVILVFIYSTYVGTAGLITKEYTLYDYDLPEEFDGLKIVHFSDLHFKRAINIKKINQIVEEINLINPDIVVFTGDLIDKDMEVVESDYSSLTEAFKKINARYGKFAVLGNHDYLNKDKIIKLFSDSEFKYLENNYETIISKSNHNIYVMGLGDVLYNMDDMFRMSNSLLDDDGFKIVLVHEPDVSDDIVEYVNPDLILGGHSHNGQFRLPFIGALYTPNGAKKYYDEYYKLDDTSLYISSGVGVSNLNIRFFNRPSINFYRINKEIN